MTRPVIIYGLLAGVAVVVTAACTVPISRLASAGAPRSTAATAPPKSTPPTPPAPRPVPPLGSAWTARWRISPGRSGGIRGFADRTSALPGHAVRLYVSTRSARFTVRAFRMGWDHGVAGQQVWHSAPLPGTRQPGPRMVDRATRTYAAPWRASLTFSTSGWPPGMYLLRLDASNGDRSFVPLTVSTAFAAGAVVLVSPVTTWQAYNTWGCCDLYQGRDGSFADRSTAVSFDRPYVMQDGSGQFIRDELGIVAEAERLGLRLDYATDIDLQEHPSMFRGASAIVSMGHDEYWSPRMRQTLAAAQADGTNLAFFGANAIFRRVRFGSTALGPDRLEINYKIAAQDPLFGHANRSVTADWPAAPDPRPESSLLGDQYGCFFGRRPDTSAVVTRPGSWLYRGVQVTADERLPHLLGPEVDAVQRQYPTPAGVESIMHSPVRCPGGRPSHADTSYFVAASGAGVFDAGTINWACEVAPSCPGDSSARTHAVVRQVTDNVLRAFSRGPVGRPGRPRLIRGSTPRRSTG